MADITVTAAKVGLVHPNKARTIDAVAGATITKGQVCYIDTSGNVGVADANAAGKIQARGIALNAAASGQAITLCKEGALYGYTLTNQAYSAPLYLSNTAGALEDGGAAGTVVPCGIVLPLSDKDRTKVFYADFRYGADYS